MDWKPYIDGLIGAVMGSVIGGGAALLAARQQINAQTSAAKAERLELRLDRARAAALLLLEHLADIDHVLHLLPKASRDDWVMSPPGSESTMTRPPDGTDALKSLRRGLLTELPVVGDPLITKHYDRLDSLLLYFSSANLTPIEVNKALGDLGRYLRWVRMLIAAFVAERPPLADVEPPKLVAGHVFDNGNDWEPDPKPDGWA